MSNPAQKIILSDPIVFKPQEGPQSAFLANEADIVLYGGARGGGKTYALLLETARNISTPNFNAVIFRRTSPQIRQSGGLWDESVTMFNHLKGKPSETRMLWKWENNVRINFATIEHDADKLGYQGAQICLMCFDELTHFNEEVFWFLMASNRSTCGVRPYIRCTCNPDSDSWVRKFIDWWIDSEGYPIKERSGVVRYFMRVDGLIKWGNSKNELLREDPVFISAFNDLKEQYLKKKGKFILSAQVKERQRVKKEYTEKIYKLKRQYLNTIKSFTFIASTVHDNKILLEKDPSYLGNLHALPLVERKRMLEGNWNIKAEAGKFFNRDWFSVVGASEIPQNGVECRYWDFAATAVSNKNKDPDYTVGIKIRKFEGKYFIIDCVRIRENPAEVEKKFIEVVATDKRVADDLGIQYKVRWEEEGGSSGKQETYRLQSILAGYDARGIKSTKSKEVRAKPFAIQCEIGNVKLQKADWNDILVNELHMFTDVGSKHDDIADGCSGAFTELCSVYIHPTCSEIEEEFSKEEIEQKNIDNYRQIEQDFLNCEDLFD